MRGVGSWNEYKAILDKTLQCIVSAHKYKKNRLTTPLSEWFTFTDEAFLLVCLESYKRKWTYEYTKEFGTREEKAALPPEAPGPLYTGRLQGTKRGWTNAGIQRFNEIMLKVARDRQANAELADQNFLQYQNFLHGRREPAVADVDEAQPQPQQRQIVYNDFDLQLLMDHAAGNNDANNDLEDNVGNNEDVDSEDESVDMQPV